MAVEVTFTLDEATVARIGEAAARLSRSQSEIIHDAVQDYHYRMGKLTEQERITMLGVLDEATARRSEKHQVEAERELEEIRSARHSGGRRTVIEG